MTAGDPMDPKTRLGAISSRKQLETVLGYIESGKQQGATLVAGGARTDIGTGKGYFLQPTVFAGVTPEMTIAREEIFGPVLAVIELADVEEAIARATVFTANNLNIKAVAAMTQSGKTVLLMSRSATTVPIYAMSSVAETRRKVTLFKGVYPVKFRGTRDPEKALQLAEDELLKRGAVQSGDYMVLTIGEPYGKAGGTNTMKIVKVGEHRGM
jgi:hypothetical protein